MPVSAMAKSYDFNKYASWSYDNHFCLKPPVLLTGSIVYLGRSFLLLIMFMATSIKGRTPGMEEFLTSGDGHPATLGVSAIPALLVLYALIRRTPSAGNFVRRIWKRGRLLLVASAVMEIATAALLLYASAGQGGDSDLLRVALLILDVYILGYVLLSKRVKDVFSDFPVA